MKKINIGIILIILSLIGMIFYLVYEENSKKKDIENVKNFLDEYYKVYNKYSLLYEEDRDIDKIIDKSKYDKYKEDMKKDLDQYLYDEINLKQNIYDNYNLKITEQLKGKYIYNSYEKTIIEYDKDKLVFNNGYIYIMPKIKLDVDKITRIATIYNKDKEKYVGDTKTQVGTDYIYEYIILKKVNGMYKIVVHSMVDPILFSFDEELKGFYV